MRRSGIASDRGLTMWLLLISTVVGLGACGSVSNVLRGDPTLARSYVDTQASTIPPAEIGGEGAGGQFTAHVPGTVATVIDADSPQDAGMSRSAGVQLAAVSTNGAGELAHNGAASGHEAVPSTYHSEPAREGGTAGPTAEETAAGLLAQSKPDAPASSSAQPKDEFPDEEEYDPWEPFNEKMFTFNRNLDKYVLKPTAKAYNVVMPEPFQRLISNGFDNIRWVPRFINSLLQGKWGGAGRELARFVINSTAGIGGLFDPAKDYWGIEKSREDFGQTLGVWGSGPGPYLVLPLLPPMTVRDGIGLGVDSFLDPLGYVLPFFWDRLGMRIGDTVNDRALNLELYEGFEESVIDMYSAVRNGYLRRREQLIRE